MTSAFVTLELMSRLIAKIPRCDGKTGCYLQYLLIHDSRQKFCRYYRTSWWWQWNNEINLSLRDMFQTVSATLQQHGPMVYNITHSMMIFICSQYHTTDTAGITVVRCKSNENVSNLHNSAGQ